ncbi:MAG: hypothetical protein U5O39_12380 [Gammaproteobacteria bacterium]|nr:hypothetical protein [Gammaproteobacteria bacterium]
MPGIELDAYALAMRLAAALDDHRIPYAIGGAHAYGLWGDP